MPYQIEACAGKPYRPSNGIEGEEFLRSHCDRCVKQVFCQYPSFAFYGGQPDAWKHDALGRPTCADLVVPDEYVGCRESVAAPSGKPNLSLMLAGLEAVVLYL